MSEFKIITGDKVDYNMQKTINDNTTLTKDKLNEQKGRVDNLIKGTPQPSEVVDARGGLPVLRDRLNKFDADLAQTKTQVDYVIRNFLANGGVRNDDTFDNTAPLQSLIDEVSNSGGGEIQVPTGDYYFKGTLILKRNVIIKGYGGTDRRESGTSLIAGATFRHIPDVADTDFFTLNQDGASDNRNGIELINIGIIGSVNSNRALSFKKTWINGKLSWIFISDFKTGMELDAGQHCSVDFLDIRNTDTCLIIETGTVTTTVAFSNSYFHFSGTPLVIKKEMAIDVTFNNCIFESCDNGIDIHPGNFVNFNNPLVDPM